MNLLEIAGLVGVDGFMHCEEVEKLVELAKGKKVLEVGSFKGLSAWAMALGAKSVFCVDTFKANSAGQVQMEGLTTLEDFKEATWRFKNVSHFVGTSEKAAETLPVGPFDLVFIDAFHDYENVRDDIRRWKPFMESKGRMVFHDYGHGDFPGVKPAVDEAFGELEGVVVTLAWTRPINQYV